MPADLFKEYNSFSREELIQELYKLKRQIQENAEIRAKTASSENGNLFSNKNGTDALLQQISTQVIEANDIQGLYERILDTAVAVMKSDFASIQMYDPDRRASGGLRLLAYRGFSSKAAEYWKWVYPSSQSSCGVALRTKERIVIPDIAASEFMMESGDQKTCLQNGILAVQSTPLISRSGAILGILSTHWREPHQPTQKELAAMDILARQASDLIEHKKISEAIKAERQLLENVLRQLPEGVIIVEAPSGKLILANQQFEKIWGHDFMPSGTLRDYDKHKAFHSDGTPYRPDDRPLVRTITTGETIEQEEIQFQRGDGSLGWMSVSSSPIHDSNQKIIAGVATCLDITEKRQSEEKLRESEQRYKTAFRTSPSILVISSLEDGYILEANDAFVKLMGYSNEEIPDLNCIQAGIWTNPEQRNKLVDLLNKQGYAKNMEAVFRTKKGEYKTILLSAEVIWIKKEAYMMSAWLDITDRKKAEEELRKSEEIFRALVTASSDVLYRMSPDWQEMRQLHSRGFLSDTLEPKSSWLQEYIHPDEQPFVTENIKKAIQSKSVFEQEHRVRRADGSFGWTFSRAVPIIDNNNEIIEWFGAAGDVTERKEAERALRKAYDELELKVKERTAELEIKNKELRDFTHIASHDLSEPLRKVLTFGSMLMERSANALDDTSKDYLHRMNNAVKRMQNLLNSLLAYSRVTTRTEAVVKTDLNAAVKDALSNIEISVKEKNAWIEIGKLPVIMADKNQMIQLFQNLVGNAVKYQKEGQIPIVTVNLHDSAIKENVYRISVEDNGIGIDEKFYSIIFNPFERLHGKNEYEGVGIGLSICKKIMDRHGGRIYVKSEQGKGSVFYLEFPLET